MPTKPIFSFNDEQIEAVKTYLQEIQNSQMKEPTQNDRIVVLVNTIKIWRILKNGEHE